ncbi:MAG: Hsp20/alpha crystallin family protein [Flavisolibacter sp.]
MKRKDNNGNLATSGRPVASFGGLVDGILQNTFNRFLDDDFWGFDGSVATGTQVPVNIRETGNTYEMEVVAPGLSKEDFNVNINDNMLTVSFEHKHENKEENKQEGYLRREYRQQAFSRSFTLDDTVEADKISAQYKDGVLYVSLPKKEGARKITKNIQIK